MESCLIICTLGLWFIKKKSSISLSRARFKMLVWAALPVQAGTVATIRDVTGWNQHYLSWETLLAVRAAEETREEEEKKKRKEEEEAVACARVCNSVVSCFLLLVLPICIGWNWMEPTLLELRKVTCSGSSKGRRRRRRRGRKRKRLFVLVSAIAMRATS